MKEPVKKDSPIKALKIKARKGNLYSLYQLYEYHLNGTYVTKDSEKADEYLAKAINIFQDQKLRLRQLKIHDFRALKALDLKFTDDNMTVIIGNNGAGKTSVLDAIAMSASWLHNRIVKNGGNGETIEDFDFTLGSESGYSSIAARFKLNNNVFAEIELAKPHIGSNAKKKNVIGEITKIGRIYKHANSLDSRFNLPLLAYYTVSRALDISRKDVSKFDETAMITDNSKFDGYANSLDGKADFMGFFRWFKRIDDIDKHRSQSTDKNSELIDQLKAIAKPDAQIQALLQQLAPSSPQASKEETADGHGLNINEIKKVLNTAVSYFMPGYGNLAIQVEPRLSLTLEKNQQKLNVLQLSQGEKTLLALLLDITRRLIVLNPALTNPLHGHGIVLIDEFDLHLHPQWQRTIIRGLPKLFKNCQFIVTTHSPQILGEVKPAQVMILQQNENNEIECHRPRQSYGLSSNDILNELMLTDENETQLIRTPEVESKLNEIYELIESESFDEAKRRISSLEKELNGEIPELVSAKLDIDLNGWDD